MKKSDLNKLKHTLYCEAIKNHEIEKDLLSIGYVYVYDIIDGRQNRCTMAVQHRSQINNNTLSDRHIDAATATVTLLFKLNRATQCAEF